jgi:hypothetical protein
MVTLLGNAVAPGIGDRYLAKTGFDSQQTGEPVGPGRPDNLFGPVPGPGATHGDFDQQAKAQSVQWLATRHRRLLAAGAGAATVVAAVGAIAQRR